MSHGEGAFWNRFAGLHDRFMRLFGPAYAQIVRAIMAMSREGDEVLEIAAGTGLIALQVAPVAARVVGIDISERMIAAARRKAAAAGVRNAEFRVGDAYRPPFPPGSFDTVIVSRAASALMQLTGFRARQKWSIDGFQAFVREGGFAIRRERVLRGIVPMLYLEAAPPGAKRGNPRPVSG